MRCHGGSPPDHFPSLTSCENDGFPPHVEVVGSCVVSRIFRRLQGFKGDTPSDGDRGARGLMGASLTLCIIVSVNIFSMGGVGMQGGWDGEEEVP